MNTYIAILRGINVGGKNKIKMAELKSLLIAEGLKSVQTYIQSGNIIFESKEKDKPQIAQLISNAIKKEWNFDVPTLILDPMEIAYAKDKNPFWSKNSEIDITKLCVTFLDNTPDQDLVNQIVPPNNCTDFFEIDGKYIFLFCPGGFARTKLTNNFFERKLKQTCTTRNWKTINKLIELSEA